MKTSRGVQEKIRMWSLLLLILGAQTKTAMSIMNCIQARDSCMNNTACHPILEVVPRVCGAEKVACSTVTITKCQAALRTLQAFPYFNPTCLCREPTSDPACNTFRDYLFDHPCTFVREKEKDPYPVDALPTCDYALDVCKKEPKCIQLLRDFRSQCKQSEDHQCKMEDGELCHDAWTKLRYSPIFGCICPNSNSRCDRIFREVNYNPCVATDPTNELNGSTTALFSLDQHRLAALSPHMSFSPAALFPPRPETLAHIHRHQHSTGFPAGPPRSRGPPHSPEHVPAPHPAALTESHLVIEESLSTPVSYHGYPSPGSFSTSKSQSGSITVQVISSSNSHDSEDSQLENPLYGPGTLDHSKPPPFVPSKPKVYTPSPHRERPTSVATISSVRAGERGPRIPLQATCLTALQGCRRDSACRGLLEQVLHYCDPTRCRQETCMKALQKFYREVEPKWALDVAFCMCRKTDNRHDQCRLAQQQLHPVCAQRGDLGVNPPSCHSLAESCRAENDCRFRLEEYEQACAVDSVTRKCAGPAIECRNAMIRILGTKLRTSCACNGTDFTQLYDCLGWQRILWVNPCVVESQRDYHRVRVIQAPTIPHQHPQSHRPSTTPSHFPPEVDPVSSFEGVLPGSDVLSTTVGIPPASKTRHSNNNGNGVGHQSTHHTPSHTSTSTLKSTTVHTRHSKTNGNDHHKVTSATEEVGVASGMFVSSTLGGSLIISDDETTTLSTTTTTERKTEPTTTLQPARYCRLHQPRSGSPDQKIREGQAKRFYRDDIPTCSELCMCEMGRPESAICTVLECLDIKHCYVKQEDEYNHLQPTYIAYRGNCLCYSGRFICEKPPPDTYTLDNGVFLFLGFSSKEEQLLSPMTRLSVKDVVEALKQLVAPESRHLFFDPNDPDESAGLEKLKALNVTDCRLGLYKIEGENLIINATVNDEEYSETTLRQPNDQLFQRERKQCLPILQVLKDLINKQHPIIHGHSLLSILKLATVQDNIPTPEPSSASRSTMTASSFDLIPVLIISSLALLSSWALTSSSSLSSVAILQGISHTYLDPYYMDS